MDEFAPCRPTNIKCLAICVSRGRPQRDDTNAKHVCGVLSHSAFYSNHNNCWQLLLFDRKNRRVPVRRRSPTGKPNQNDVFGNGLTPTVRLYSVRIYWRICLKKKPCTLFEYASSHLGACGCDRGPSKNVNVSVDQPRALTERRVQRGLFSWVTPSPV